MHFDILDNQRRELLPLFSSFSDEGFYLAGGTGLALQIGHRDSIDFDFFKEGDFDTALLATKLTQIFAGHDFLITQQEENTLSCIVDTNVRLSFFGYRHSLLYPLITTEYFNIASVADIACMKFSAITSRSLEKDYIDLYFILQNIPLKALLADFVKKYPTLDVGVILKSLVYFEDVLHEPVKFKESHNVSFETIQIFLKKITEEYFRD